MMILSKIKTLIEYANFGICISRYVNGETVIDELCCPRSITKCWPEGIGPFTVKCKKLSGYIKTVDAAYMFTKRRVIEEVDLPYCTSFLGDAAWGTSNEETNTTVKIIKLPKIRTVGNRLFAHLRALEYLELGAVTSFATTALIHSENVKEIYVKEGTTASLYLYPCPNLTQECLHKIIENLADMTGATGPNFHVGADNLKKIDQEHIIMLEEKNFLYQ